MIDIEKLTSTASGIGPVTSRHRLPSCSLVRSRVSAGNSSISPPSVRTDPPGRSSDERRTASATSSKVMPCRGRAVSETSMEIS